jgi:hypothetical protein
MEKKYVSGPLSLPRRALIMPHPLPAHSDKRPQDADHGGTLGADTKRARAGDEADEERRKQLEKEEKIRLRREKLLAWQKQRSGADGAQPEQDDAELQQASGLRAAAAGGNAAKAALLLGAKLGVKANALFAEESDRNSPTPAAAGAPASGSSAKPASKYNFKKPSSALAKMDTSTDAQPAVAAGAEAEEVDPLDAFMVAVVDEVQKITEQDKMQLQLQHARAPAYTDTLDEEGEQGALALSLLALTHPATNSPFPSFTAHRGRDGRLPKR